MVHLCPPMRLSHPLLTQPHTDIHHDLFKTRIAPTGTFVEEAIKGKELTGDAERVARQKAEGYCTFRTDLRLLRAWAAGIALSSAWRVQAVRATAAHHLPTAPIPAAATLATRFASRTYGEDGASSTPTRSSR